MTRVTFGLQQMCVYLNLAVALKKLKYQLHTSHNALFGNTKDIQLKGTRFLQKIKTRITI